MALQMCRQADKLQIFPMKLTLNLSLVLILVSCANAPVTGTPTAVISIKIAATATSPSPSATLAPTITPTITFTPEPSCDPLTAEFCVTDGNFVLQRPIQPPANDLIDPIYGYGSTANGTREPHHGVEFSNASGTPVHAAADGTVIFAGPDAEAIYAPWYDFYGNLVIIEHRDQLFTLYAHLSKIDVTINQQVAAGEKIGEVGSTGGAVGSHLHFEVRRGNGEDYFATQNPELWLIPAKDETGNLFGTLMLSLLDEAGNLLEDANFTIGYYSEPSQSPLKVYYAAPYSPDMLDGGENLALGELLAGHYRIVVETNGRISERWVEVESGKLTQVVFVVK
jgi:murein DD-endopeptidase MepM/ murein hydrolase activator NlpD